MKRLSAILAVCIIIGQGIASVHGMGCENKFKGKDKVEACVNNEEFTACSVDWDEINGVEVCRRITEGVQTVTTTTTTTESAQVVRTETQTVTSTTTPATVVSTVTNTEHIIHTLSETVIQHSTETITATVRETVTQTPAVDFVTKTVQVTPTCPQTTSAAAGLSSPQTSSQSLVAATPSPPQRNVNNLSPSESGLKSTNGNKIPDEVTYALGAATGMLFLLLVAIVVGWVCTCYSMKRRHSERKIVVSARQPTTDEHEHRFDNSVYNTETQMELGTQEKQDLPAYYSIVQPDTSGSGQEEAIIYEQVDEEYDYGTVASVNGVGDAAAYEIPINDHQAPLASEERTSNDYSVLKH